MESAGNFRQNIAVYSYRVASFVIAFVVPGKQCISFCQGLIAV